MVVETPLFKVLIKEFNGLIENMPPVNKVKDKLVDIKNRATGNTALTYRQSEAINDRCTNYINGTYGKNLSRKK